VNQTSPSSPTLDTLFQRVLSRKPDAIALVDPINKQRITGQPPKRLTYAQADRAIAALAAHFIESGLPSHSLVAVQLPNTIEFILTLLAANRAGLVVALIPQLWRQAELVAALNRTSARAIVTMDKIDGVIHSDIAMNAAAEVFSIRHVCGFGGPLPEGMAALDEAIAREAQPSRSTIQDGRKAAIISFDVTTDGFRAVPRPHLSLIAGGLAVSMEAGVPQGASIMSAFAPSSFAGIVSSLAAWLLTGGTLSLHHPFDNEVLEEQLAEQGCDTLVAPAQLALRLDETDLPARLPNLRRVVGLWRTPEQVASGPPWMSRQISMTDVYLFGEAGLFGVRRTADDGTPALVRPGVHGAPRETSGASGSSVAGEILLTPKGTLGLRGPMVPIAAYAPPRPPSDSLVPQPPRDYVDTEYAARLDRATGAISITAPPAGIMAVGGYRFLAQDLQEWSRRLGQGTLLTALPDRLSGHRLAGRAQDNARAREALTELGLNPLMVEAFRERSTSA
jgi:hypothetical protein